MRRRLRPHIGSHLLGSPHQGYGVGGTDVLHVDSCPRVESQHAVSGHHHILRHRGRTLNPQLFGRFPCVDAVIDDKGRVLLVKAQRQPQCLCLLHGCHCQLFIQDRLSIIGKAHGSGPGQSLQIRQFPAFHSLGDSRAGHHPNPGGLSLLQHIGQSIRRVHRRLCVGHTDHRGKAACRRCCCTGLNILLVGQPRISEMDMSVNQSGSYGQSGCVHNLLPVSLKIRTYFADYPVLNPNVHRSLPSALRVQHITVFNDHLLSSCFSLSFCEKSA